MCVCAWFIEFFLARTEADFVCSGCPGPSKVQECQLIKLDLLLRGRGPSSQVGSLAGSSQLIITIAANRLRQLVIVIRPAEKRKWRGDTTKTRKSPATCWAGKVAAHFQKPCRFVSVNMLIAAFQREEESLGMEADWGHLRSGSLEWREKP